MRLSPVSAARLREPRVRDIHLTAPEPGRFARSAIFFRAAGEYSPQAGRGFTEALANKPDTMVTFNIQE
jgi:hypothetical protein